ncbi:hypothetical protein J437_LFUL006186, partial [Ladona fulva]
MVENDAARRPAGNNGPRAKGSAPNKFRLARSPKESKLSRNAGLAALGDFSPILITLVSAGKVSVPCRHGLVSETLIFRGRFLPLVDNLSVFKKSSTRMKISKDIKLNYSRSTKCLANSSKGQPSDSSRPVEMRGQGDPSVRVTLYCGSVRGRKRTPSHFRHPPCPPLSSPSIPLMLTASVISAAGEAATPLRRHGPFLLQDHGSQTNRSVVSCARRHFQ